MPTPPPIPGISIGIRGASGDFDFYLDIVHVPVADTLTKGFARGFGCSVSSERLQDTFHRCGLGGLAHDFTAAVLLQPHRFLDQIAGNLFDIAANIANLGKFGCLYLDKRRVGELGQATADFGFATAGRTDHQNVLGRNFVAQFRRQTLPTPAIAHRHGDGALGVVLTDNMFVKRGNNRLGVRFWFIFILFPADQLALSMVSTVNWSLV
jgi:hypothetical protein